MAETPHLGQVALLLACLVLVWAGYLQVRLRQVLLLVRGQDAELEAQQGRLLDVAADQLQLMDVARQQEALELRVKAVEVQLVKLEALLGTCAETQLSLSRVQKVQQDQLDLLLPDRRPVPAGQGKPPSN